MKANATVYIVIGILLVLAIYSIYRLNQVQGVMKKVSGKLLEADTTTTTTESTSTEQPARSVKAGDFIDKLTGDLGKIDSVTLNFTEPK